MDFLLSLTAIVVLSPVMLITAVLVAVKREALGLPGLECVITDSLGGAQFRKPCDIAFRIMQGRMGIPYAQMVYIGDNPAKDFKACKQLGIQGIWFRNKDGLYA